ncbi:MAG: tetratricopeptide repeat protein [Deltaproteobacteria bacterium]
MNLALALALAPTSVLAQSASSPAPPTGSAAASPSPDSPAMVEAREHRRRGRALLDAGNPNGAIAEFQRVYELLEGHPRRFMVLSNLAVVAFLTDWHGSGRPPAAPPRALVVPSRTESGQGISLVGWFR